MGELRKDNWSGGANNRAPVDRIPKGQARRLVNLQPDRGGTLSLAPQFALDIPMANVRAMFELGGRLIVAAGSQLLSINPDTGAQSLLANLVATGPVAGAELNGRLYIRTTDDRLSTDGMSVEPWGADNAMCQVEITAGGLPGGVYKLAVTRMAGGHESGADVLMVQLPDKSGLRITSGDAEPLAVYLSTHDGQTLYHCAELNGVCLLTSEPDGAGRQLVTGGFSGMPPVEQLVAAGSMLVGAQGRLLYHTDPMRPHLVSQVEGFVGFEGEIALLAPIPGNPTGVYVNSANATYLLDGLGTNQINRRALSDYGAVSGTYVRLPDGTVSWFSRYGQVRATAAGELQLLHAENFVPRTASHGASALVERDGEQRVLTALRDSQFNGLCVGDSWSIEVEL